MKPEHAEFNVIETRTIKKAFDVSKRGDYFGVYECAGKDNRVIAYICNSIGEYTAWVTMTKEQYEKLLRSDYS